MNKRLLIIGSGPKAMAIAAKAAALEVCGYPVPEIVIVEKNECGANWTGSYGYTDGQQTLGTLPEKDVGFPYFPHFSDQVIQYMVEKFSWNVYLATSGNSWMDLGEWVDRGRPSPPHWVWANYFKWIERKTQAQLRQGEVKHISLKGDRWEVTYSNGPQSFSEEADGIVVTGPGDCRRIKKQPTSDRILDGKTFWQDLGRFQLPALGSHEDPRQVCVIGNGETAASVVVELLRRLDPQSDQIVLVNKQGMIFSRGENYFENSVYTYQDKVVIWKDLTEEHRDQIVRHTDRGVFSLSSLSTINHARNVLMIAGEVDSIELDSPSEVLVHINYPGPKQPIPDIAASYVIVAIGFDHWSFQTLFDPSVSNKLLGTDNPDKAQRKKIISTVADDLSLPWPRKSSEGLPRLHVPMLAGVAQGPGFPNLSCLGALADRILKPYVLSS